MGLTEGCSPYARSEFQQLLLFGLRVQALRQLEHAFGVYETLISLVLRFNSNSPSSFPFGFYPIISLNPKPSTLNPKTLNPKP